MGDVEAAKNSRNSDAVAHCPTCGFDITQVRIVRNNIPLLFSACSQCDTTTWASDGEELPVDAAISAMAEVRDEPAPVEPRLVEAHDASDRSPLASMKLPDIVELVASVRPTNAA